MKRYIKLIFLLFFCISSFEGFAQNDKERIETAKRIEVEIDDFIRVNVVKYSLNDNLKKEIEEHLKAEGVFSVEKLNDFVLEYKKSELRELYFKTYPDKRNFFTPESFGAENKAAICVNGGFENANNVTTDFAFGTRVGNIAGCGTPAAVPNAVTLPTNDFNAPITLVSSLSPNFQQFDPFLSLPQNGNVQVPTISPNGGNNCIKLNGNNAGSSVTSMSRSIAIGANDDFIEYEFSLFLQDSGHNDNQRPTFRIDLIVGGVVVNTRCYIARPNCLYNTAHNPNVPTNITGQDVYFTGWQCDRINVSNFRGTNNAILRFTITDCSQGGHYGTVYIDNVCNYSCAAPAQGSLQINPLGNCESLGSGTYQVCGNFVPPVNSVLTSMSLSYSQNGGPFIPMPASAPVINGNNYCFTVPSNIFGANPNGNTFQFQVTANYTQTCPIGSFNMQNSTMASVTFTNCCPMTLNISTPLNGTQQFERMNWIRQNSRINNNAYVRYHAGNFIELTPGFETRTNVRYVAYIDGCTGNYLYKNGVDSDDEVINDTDEAISKLVKIDQKLMLYPNPTTGVVTIAFGDAAIQNVTVSSIDGKSTFFKNTENALEYKLDLSSFASGIYILTVETADGQLINSKLIKN